MLFWMSGDETYEGPCSVPTSICCCCSASAAWPAGAHKLVPLYACHLRAGLRHTTYQIFFEQLLAQVGVWASGGRQADGCPQVVAVAVVAVVKVVVGCGQAAIGGWPAEVLQLQLPQGPVAPL